MPAKAAPRIPSELPLGPLSPIEMFKSPGVTRLLAEVGVGREAGGPDTLALQALWEKAYALVDDVLGLQYPVQGRVLGRQGRDN